jgi:hypothetical protein
LARPVHEAIGLKGCCVNDCKEILEALQLPLEKPFETLSRLLVERGVKNQYDLIKNDIFVLADSLAAFKEKLFDFLLKSNQPLQPAPTLAPVQDSSVAFEMARVAEKIYKCVTIPFFCALQFYAQPVWTLAGAAAGAAGGFMAHSFFDNEAFEFYLGAVFLPEVTFYNGPNLDKVLYIFLSAQLTMGCFTRLGFIPALSLGLGLPGRLYTAYKSIRSVL